MGGPLSVTFANIFLTKLENEIVRPIEPTFYKRFVDDVINRRVINQPDRLFNLINNYHQHIRFTIEVNPTKFLDTNLIIKNNHHICSSETKQVTHTLDIGQKSRRDINEMPSTVT